MLDAHVKSGDIMAARVGAWVYPEVVEPCPDLASAVEASACVPCMWGPTGKDPVRIDGSGLCKV